MNHKSPDIQKPGEKSCGQHCLAMILGITVKEAIELVGHDKSTTTKELTPHFKAQGMKRGHPVGAALCFTKFKDVKQRGSNWHWCCTLNEHQIYDPCMGVLSREDYFNILDGKFATNKNY